MGSITAGLPEMTAGWWLPMARFPQLAATAVRISFVSLLESISIARALAEPQPDVRHPLDANQEMLGTAQYRNQCHHQLFIAERVK